MSGVFGRVLVVDDNKVIRQLIRVNLELEGFEVVTAADGAECLDVVHQVRPDVVTLDVVMPRLDGPATVERLRADPRTRHLPVAIISACGEREASGGDAFLAKPFEPVELVRVVRQLMHRERRDRPGGAGAGGADGGEDPVAVDERVERSVRSPQGRNARHPRKPHNPCSRGVLPSP
ncbi:MULTISPECIES: response regulator [unclassified Streptomyces]|uniref:response regulator n=1 Tax=unclassified Streptomyces TaxID=2593676 RepID=UPI002948BFBD|nr:MULTISPECIES: response regulator [unclassified Streptomyces]